jgi:hypothetical protein
MAPPAEATDKHKAAREVIDILHEIATLLVSTLPHSLQISESLIG